MLVFKTKYCLSSYPNGFEDPHGLCVPDLFWTALFFMDILIYLETTVAYDNT